LRYRYLEGNKILKEKYLTAKQSKNSLLSRAEQSRAEQSRAEQSRAEQSRAEQSRAEHMHSMG